MQLGVQLLQLLVPRGRLASEGCYVNAQDDVAADFLQRERVSLGVSTLQIEKAGRQFAGVPGRSIVRGATDDFRHQFIGHASQRETAAG